MPRRVIVKDNFAVIALRGIRVLSAWIAAHNGKIAMYAAGSIEEFAQLYAERGGPVFNGVWSVLIASSPELSADFAQRYFEIFNKVVHDGWNLAVYARHSFGERGVSWTPSPELHKHVVALRNQIAIAGDDVPELGFAFFDPNIGVFEKRSVVLPLNHLKLGDEGFFRAGFEATHRCIMTAFEKSKLEPYRTIPPDRVSELLDEVQQQLFFHRIRSHVTKPLAAIGNAGLGALFGKI